MPNLSDHHRRHIIELLEQGQDLPPDYKHLLFPPERQEYELVYAGKEREEDILAETLAVPLQPVKTFGNGGDGWHNLLIFGDNLQRIWPHNRASRPTRSARPSRAACAQTIRRYAIGDMR